MKPLREADVLDFLDQMKRERVLLVGDQVSAHFCASTHQLHTLLTDWCLDHEFKLIGTKTFSLMMVTLGYERMRSNGSRWKSIALFNEDRFLAAEKRVRTFVLPPKRVPWKTIAAELAERLSYRAYCDEHPLAEEVPETCPACHDRAVYRRWWQQVALRKKEER